MWSSKARLVCGLTVVSIACLLGIWHARRRRLLLLLRTDRRYVAAPETSAAGSGGGSRRQRRKQESRQVLVVADPNSCNDAMAALAASLPAGDDPKVVGMDCEWVTDGVARPVRRPVSLLQLASNDVCLLLRLCKLHTDQRTLPACIEAFLADASVAKVGVAIREDAAKLKEDYGITVQGCLDLRHLAGCHTREWSCLGLKGLSSAVLGAGAAELDKSNALRCSDWEAAKLSDVQVRYAAEDAFVALRIHDRLMCLIESASAPPAPATVITSDGNIGGTWDKMAAGQQNYSPCYGIADNDIVQQQSWLAAEQATAHRPTLAATQPSGSTRGSLPVPGCKYPTYAVRKRPLYDNCIMLAPDGQPLSTCNTKKARWYLDKGIAVMVCEEPLTVRLMHEPRGRADEQQLLYYVTPKENVCVVCGSDRSFVRKNIVPREYRRHFPAKLKDHSSHDILLLCALCHQRCDMLDSEFKQLLAALYDAPSRRQQQQQGRDRTDAQNDAHKVASAAKALIRVRESLPADRRAEYEALVRSRLGVDDSGAELTEDLLLKAASSFGVRRPATTEDEDRHGYRVVQHVLQQGKLLEFERQWRQRFVDLMSPRHLPPFWSVDYCHVSNSDSPAVE